MKHIILLFLSFLSFLSLMTKTFAETIQNVEQKGVTIKPIKVSELNANLFSAIYDFFSAIKKNIFEGLVSLKDFVETGEWLITELKNPAMRNLMGSFGIRLVVSLVLAFAIAQLIAGWLRPQIYELLLNKGQPVPQKYKKLIQGTFLSAVTPLIFGFLLYTIFRTINPSDGVYLETVRILSSGFVTIWILLNVTRVFLRPLTPEHQHIPLSKGTLNSLYLWIRRIVFVALFGFFALETGRLINLPSAGERLLLQSSSFAIAIMAIFMMISLHRSLRDWIQVQREKPQRSRLKRGLLPYLEYSYIPFIILIVISYITWVTPDYDRFQIIVWKFLFTFALLPLLRYGAYCLRKIRILYIHKNLKHFSSTFSERALFYGRQIDCVLISLLYTIAAVFILDLWDFHLYYFIFSPACKSLAEKVFSIFIIIIAALFVNRAGTGLLNKYLNIEQESQNEAQKQKMARFKTIHSVSRNILRIAIWAPAVLLILAELEVDILPLLAPVAALIAVVGFGLQSLMKDFVTGFFMLLEDAFAVEDLVVINGQMGRIESLTVRVVRLRATDGSLYTFPYGSISSLCNQNRDFSAAVMLFQVGIDVDINQIYEILEKISKDLRKDPKTRALVMDSIQIDGINEVSDHALQIRAIIKTKPSKHYKIRWAFNLLLKQYLELYHIPNATPRQISYNYPIEK